MRFNLSLIKSFFWLPLPYRTIDDWVWYSFMWLWFNIDIRWTSAKAPSKTKAPNIVTNWDGSNRPLTGTTSVRIIGVGIPEYRGEDEIFE